MRQVYHLYLTEGNGLPSGNPILSSTSIAGPVQQGGILRLLRGSNSFGFSLAPRKAPGSPMGLPESAPADLKMQVYEHSSSPNQGHPGQEQGLGFCAMATICCRQLRQPITPLACFWNSLGDVLRQLSANGT